MSTPINVRIRSAPPPTPPPAPLDAAMLESASAPSANVGARGVIGWICTNNPFYALSAALFLAGLYISFGEQAAAEDTWALMAGLTAYTLLLAVTGCLLVRFAHVWEDVRTILLLVVLMFLVTSLTFDRVLAQNPALGMACNLGGLLVAVLVSETVFHATGLELRPLFRGPYYLILGLFFLYPLAISSLVATPRSEAAMWGLFGFATAAGLVFLTLLPAIRRGPDYVEDNGSPWRWPLYPWVLFGLLALAVPVRAYLLCWSLHMPEFVHLKRLIFGAYFLVPFGFALAVLLLEMGLVARRRGVVIAALLVPAGLLLLSAIGHRSDPFYREFLRTLTGRLGGHPVYLTLIGAACFYGYAAFRKTPLAFEALTATLAALAFIGPDAPSVSRISLHPAPIVVAAALQLVLGLWRQSARGCLIGAVLFAVAAFALPADGDALALRGPLALHLVLVAILLIGAAFDDALGKALRLVGVTLVVLACLAVTFVPFEHPVRELPWAVALYPLVMASLLVAYGVLLQYRPALAAAALVPAYWIGTYLWRGYAWARQVVTGLDYLALSLLVLAIAVAVSVGKSRAFQRRLAQWKDGPDPSESEGTPAPSTSQSVT